MTTHARRQAMSWVEAVQRYTRVAASVPVRFGLSPADADDVLQSTWLTAFEKCPEPPPADEFVAWIVTIAYWKTMGFLRDAQRAPDVRRAPRAEDVSRAPGVADVVARAEEEQVVRDALATLPERDRRLLTELFLAPTPLSYADAAQLLGVAGGSVGALRARALERLRDALQARGVFS